MTDQKVLDVVRRYRERLENFKQRPYLLSLEHRLTQTDWPELEATTKAAHMLDSIESFIKAGRREKAMRWLGFVQGVLFVVGIFSIEEMANHNREVE